MDNWVDIDVGGRFRALARPVSSNPIDGEMFLVGTHTRKPPMFTDHTTLGIHAAKAQDKYLWTFDNPALARAFIRHVFGEFNSSAVRGENPYVHAAQRATEMANAYDRDQDKMDRLRAALYFWGRYELSTYDEKQKARAKRNMQSLRKQFNYYARSM